MRLKRKLGNFFYQIDKNKHFFSNMNQCIPAYWDELTVGDKNLFITRDLLTIEMVFSLNNSSSSKDYKLR